MEQHTLTTMRRRLRSAFEFARSVEPRTLPSRRDLYLDAALAVLIVVAARLTSHGGGNAGPLLVAAVLLAARRLFPLSVCVLLVMEVLAARYRGEPMAVVIVVFAGYSAVRYSRFRGAALVTVPWLWVIVGTFLWGSTALLILVSLALTVTVGYAVHAIGERDRMLAEHEAATRRALELERARIASELHDVVTHSVSVMIVQAGAARQVLAEAPGEAREALLAVEASGRAAMTELRHLLGLLSPTEAPGGADGALGRADGAPGRADGAATAELEPQPGLAQLHTLVDRLTAAGLPIELRVGELPQDLSPGLDLAVFRVIQESLTNVLKHAGKPRTTVSLTYGDGQLVVEVADAGRPIVAAAPAVPAGARRGLIGLRERIALYGGVLDAGPRNGGGWVVRARFPIDAAPPVRERDGNGLAAATGGR
ncbi:MAG: sensor histidine kinase [Solirubrobacteraceae bacterium]